MFSTRDVISELRKVGDGRADPHLATWISSRDSGCFYFADGDGARDRRPARREARPGAGGASAELARRAVLPEFSDRTLAMDSAVARRCADLYVPDPRSKRDALIAATALVHGMNVVTRNVRDFEATRVAPIDPWTDRA